MIKLLCVPLVEDIHRLGVYRFFHPRQGSPNKLRLYSFQSQPAIHNVRRGEGCWRVYQHILKPSSTGCLFLTGIQYPGSDSETEICDEALAEEFWLLACDAQDQYLWFIPLKNGQILQDPKQRQRQYTVH